jgi:oleandomycin transport system ATP-binding protein
VISGLQDERIEVTELALRLASLDEVFMALTGHSADQGGADQGGADQGGADQGRADQGGAEESSE